MAGMPRPVTFGSKWEEYFYDEMVHAKRVFEYQVSFFGGTHERMGTIADYVDRSPGLLFPIVIYVDGPYWHRPNKGKEVEDRLKRARLKRYGYQVKVIGSEAATRDGCRKWIKENLP
jgi:hypothetical protein